MASVIVDLEDGFEQEVERLEVHSRPRNLDLKELRDAASRAQEAAVRLNAQTRAHQFANKEPPRSRVSAPHLGPLTPEDSSEEVSFNNITDKRVTIPPRPTRNLAPHTNINQTLQSSSGPPVGSPVLNENGKRPRQKASASSHAGNLSHLSPASSDYKRRKGRPPGSVNKPKPETYQYLSPGERIYSLSPTRGLVDISVSRVLRDSQTQASIANISHNRLPRQERKDPGLSHDSQPKLYNFDHYVVQSGSQMSIDKSGMASIVQRPRFRPREDFEFLFVSEIEPLIRQAMRQYQEDLPGKIVLSTGEKCAEQIVNSNLRNISNAGGQLDEAWRSIIIDMAHRMLQRKLYEFEKRKASKTTKNVTQSENLRLESPNMSLLGPGQISLITKGNHKLRTDNHTDVSTTEHVRSSPDQRTSAKLPAAQPLSNQPTLDPQTRTLSRQNHPRKTHSIASTLRHRELGFQNRPGSNSRPRGTVQSLRSHISERLRCWRNWTGASKDVVAASWAPDGNMFGIGASTDLDDLNIQYNRGNNLLFGNLETNSVTEIPDHWIPRPRPELISHGPNALEDTYNAVDSCLYTTVSHVCFSEDSSQMYTSSFDKTIKVWDLKQTTRPKCTQTFEHEANVEVMTLSSKLPDLLASGQRIFENSIRVYDLQSLDYKDDNMPVSPMISLSSTRAKRFELSPTCLQWGTTTWTRNLLLAGFAEAKHDELNTNREGDLCLWDVETSKSFKLSPSAHSVFDICWHPTLPLFAAATAPGSRNYLTDRHNTRSVIRTYRPLEAASRIVEYECPALDINDVRFHPRDDHYISASCTNNTTYIWDVRSPETILHTLRHGPAIDTLDETRSAESQDTGVRFTAWDQAGAILYTGSSDGVIKSWDIFRNPDDVLVRDIACFDSGIMTAAFSPDHTNLLVGLSKGAVQILSTAPWTHPSSDDGDHDAAHDTPSAPYETIKHIHASVDTSTSFNDTGPNAETGSSIASSLLASGQLTLHPTLGVGKGPNYNGPWALDLTSEASDRRRVADANPRSTELVPDVRAQQLDRKERKKGRKAGGRVSGEEVRRYREAERVAGERNVGFMAEVKRERRNALERGEAQCEMCSKKQR